MAKEAYVPAANLFWNFSIRPAVSTYFNLPVKNGWHSLQISTFNSFLILRVVNLFPQPQVTCVSTYLGWISAFITLANNHHFKSLRYPSQADLFLANLLDFRSPESYPLNPTRATPTPLSRLHSIGFSTSLRYLTKEQRQNHGRIKK